MEDQINKTFNYLIKVLAYFEVDFEDVKEKGVKPFIELTFLLNLIRCNTINNNHDLNIIESFILDELEHKDFEAELKIDILGIPGLSVLEEFLLSRKKDNYNSVLKDLVEVQKLDKFIERTPFRTMDVKYALNKAGIKDNLPSFDYIYQKTILGQELPLVYYSQSASYSLTHTIFYLTDMGENYFLSTPIKNIDFILQTLIGECIINRDLDILAELLLCVLFLDSRININTKGLFEYAIQFILKNQRMDGSFPAPVVSKSKRKKVRFEEDYHTTLVCLGVLICYQKRTI